ncbi:MAG: hypothetical protein IKY87_02625 [Paludibacteraceae bacterium]|nr:hypothetical protein [Paludibacteraceae bacterium]
MDVFNLSREQLLADLYQAYFDARRHKRNKPYQQRFEAHLDHNLNALCYALYSRTYKPYPSTCFIITDPKKREVFAADFRDRIVHHLYYNYTHALYERTFIYDTYSCIRNRGTHFGIKRLEQHIRQESQHYTVPCYVLKMDISGYFMHINRQRLLDICLDSLARMSTHRVLKHVPKTWQEVLDMDFVRYLTREIVLLNPIEDCRLHGSEEEWADLPKSKSLFHSPAGCGLPIGNLTSQLFSNVYLNVLDQYVKRELGCRHYGRYVDDFYVVSADREYLLEVAERVKEMLAERLDLEINDGKTKVHSIWHGVEFLGAYVKPYRQYASRQMVARMCEKLRHLPWGDREKVMASLQSYEGLLSHGRNRRLWTNCTIHSALF